MWRKFKWNMFVTSFIPLWISIVVLDAWNIVSLALEKWDDKSQVFENLQNILCSSYIQLISIAGIAVLVLCSIVGINSFLNKKLTVKSVHPKGTVKKATKANKLSSEFLLAYILPMIAFDFGDPQKLVLFLIYFLVLAYLCIRNNNIYTNILLEFKGYRIYTCDFECIILSFYIFIIIYCRILSDRIPICPSGYTITVIYDGYSIFANSLTLFV